MLSCSSDRNFASDKNMKEFIISLLLCVLSGTLASAVCPKTSIGKPIGFLCMTVVTASVISLFFSAFTSGSFSLGLPEISEYDYSEKANASISSAAEKTVAEKLFSTVYEHLCVFPESVKTKVEYSDGNFYLVSAEIFVETDLAEELEKYIYEKTGMEVTVSAP